MSSTMTKTGTMATAQSTTANKVSTGVLELLVDYRADKKSFEAFQKGAEMLGSLIGDAVAEQQHTATEEKRIVTSNNNKEMAKNSCNLQWQSMCCTFILQFVAIIVSLSSTGKSSHCPQNSKEICS